MSAIQVTIHSAGTGTDALGGKQGCDGLTVTFQDGTLKETFLSWKSFRAFCLMKIGQAAKPTPPVAAPVGNGQPAAAK